MAGASESQVELHAAETEREGKEHEVPNVNGVFLLLYLAQVAILQQGLAASRLPALLQCPITSSFSLLFTSVPFIHTLDVLLRGRDRLSVVRVIHVGQVRVGGNI